MKIKILNLYCGIGGNRKLWDNNKVEITAIENNEEIAKIYQDFFPNDKVIVADAHQYLLEHYKEFDFIWSSPPCPTHSRVRFMAAISEDERNKHPSFNPKFPDLKLYEEIIFLQHHFKGKYVIENVISYYNPLIKPFIYQSHYYWSNFLIFGKKIGFRCHNGSVKEKQELKGFDLSKYKLESVRKDQILRNCVEPKAGLEIFNMAFKTKQTTLK
ncbi:MAG TPA: DNA cytosine methyltransferase [Candidatus Paceibacterota bacterium]|nr:DNA cytosine methyltransferase [Candidatus Paceibacterota bacterium]